MRKLLAIAFALATTTTVAHAQVWVQGHVNRDGTYTQPHMRSAPNSSTYDNWSTKPNVNPYTGQRGTENPYPQPRVRTYSPPAYTPPANHYNPYAPNYSPPCYYNCRSGG